MWHRFATGGFDRVGSGRYQPRTGFAREHSSFISHATANLAGHALNAGDMTLVTPCPFG
jgi:hypothetical protein